MGDAGKHVLVGASAGIVSDIVTHPLSTVKTRLQIQGAGGGVHLYRSATHALVTIVRQEGPAGLYRGLGAVLVGALPSQALYFCTYEASKARLGNGHSGAGNFTAGALAQLSGSLVGVPVDIVRQRLQIQGQMQVSKSCSGSFAAFAEIIRSEGVTGIYRGFPIHQMTLASFHGIYFAVYDKWKGWCIDAGYADEHDRLYPEAQLACSSVAGIIGAVLTNPLDVLKTRLQVARMNPEMFPFKSSWEAARHLLQREGATALLDGVLARILWLTPRLAISVSAYEHIKAMLG
mmetsp:Transcript_105563/g.191964  ORF Transcript_105563/g.191964 Transcript_105563/m.191964 type:complete len:290 (+) Transcript_105563:90-959(+)